MFYARLADRYLKNNQIDQAMENAEKAALMHPHDATARFVLAKCCYVKQDFDKADKNLHDALALDPQHLGALDLQTDLFSGQGKPDSAQDNLNRLIDLDPLNEAVHLKTAIMPQPSAKESFEDDWNAALLPENERPAPKFDSESDAFPEFENEMPQQELDGFESDFDSQVENGKDDFDETAQSLTDESISDKTRFEDFFEDDSFDTESLTEESFLNEPLPLEPLPDDSAETEPLRDESFDENPFADFEDTSFDKDDVLEDIEMPAPSKVEQVALEEPVVDEFSGDDMLDDSDDDDFEIDQSKFKEEKSKFTRLLDDIFSSSIDEEEQQEQAERTAIERIADSDSLGDESLEFESVGKSDDDFEPLMSRDEIILPEEKILESDRSQHDELYDFNDTDNIQHDPQESANEDFSSFLESLDIKDDSKSEKELPNGFDDPLPKLDDDFAMSDDLKNILEPLSTEDDWTQELSDAVVDEKSPEPEEYFDDEPEPEPEPEQDTPPAVSKSSKEDKGKFYTPTLGEIYAAQGQYAKAISIYENLLKGEPDNQMYQSKLELLRKKLAEQQ
jgi:tetratricopeptide (TPR) repeat protein